MGRTQTRGVCFRRFCGFFCFRMFFHLGNSQGWCINHVFSFLFNGCEEAEEAEEAERDAQLFTIGSARGAGRKPWKRLMAQPR